MMRLLFVFVFISSVAFGQNVHIPDANFKKCLVENAKINTNGDNEIQLSEAKSYSDTIDCSNREIEDLTGIEVFTAITSLNCERNKLKLLDVSKNTALTNLNCNNNSQSYSRLSLDLSNNTF